MAAKSRKEVAASHPEDGRPLTLPGVDQHLVSEWPVQGPQAGGGDGAPGTRVRRGSGWARSGHTARHAVPRGPQAHLTDVPEVLDVHPLGVHDLLDDVGPHLLLALGVLVAAPARVLRRLLARGAAGALRQLLLVDPQLRSHAGHRSAGRHPARPRFPLPGDGEEGSGGGARRARTAELSIANAAAAPAAPLTPVGILPSHTPASRRSGSKDVEGTVALAPEPPEAGRHSLGRSWRGTRPPCLRCGPTTSPCGRLPGPG